MNVPCTVLSALLLLTTGVCAAADDGSEPPVVYTLEINGQPHELSPDKPVTIDGNFSNPEVTLRVSKTRMLEAAGLAFSYPAYFTFEADTSDSDVQTWIAEGKDVTVMLFRFSEEITPRALAQSTADELAADAPKMEDVTLKLGGHDCPGVKATMALDGQSIIQQTLALPTKRPETRLLVIQEVRSAGDPESAEVGATLKLIASSLQMKP